jgi:simple sugar transport system permease protein
MTLSERSAEAVEAVALPLLAMAGALLLFGGFIFAGGKSPLQAWLLLFQGAFGDWFSWQNTLQRAAPLMLTALCVAVPARAGLIVIGGEGALVLGGLACAALPYLFAPPAGIVGTAMVLAASAAAGAAWVALAGALRQYRGVNETISSLLLAYTAIALFKHLVEGPMRNPASLNKPSTRPLADSLLIGALPGADIHWGLVFGIVACVALGTWLFFTTSGFATRVVGGNARAARLVGLPSTRIVIAACAIGGACAGLAGGIEVAAVHTAANASLIAGLGYTGILVSFVARHNPWVVMPVAVLFGGFGSAGSLLQRRMDVPDASVLVLQGFAFLLILASEALRGRLLARSTQAVAAAAPAQKPVHPEPVEGPARQSTPVRPELVEGPIPIARGFDKLSPNGEGMAPADGRGPVAPVLSGDPA